jgi:hypothetical protein
MSLTFTTNKKYFPAVINSLTEARIGYTVAFWKLGTGDEFAVFTWEHVDEAGSKTITDYVRRIPNIKFALGSVYDPNDTFWKE